MATLVPRCGRLLLAAGLLSPTACGGAPPPAPAAPVAAPAPTAAAAPDAPAGPKVDAAAAQKCLDAATAKRAKFSGEPPKVTVKHVLVKWTGSKNPDPKVTRSREQACLRAIEARDKVATAPTSPRW